MTLKQYFRKRTNLEEQEAFSLYKDKTGGYRFLPWLVWKRAWYFLYLAICLFGIYSALRDGFNWIFLAPAGLIVFVFFALMWSYFNDGGGRK